ncbi:hypothetical protein JW905_00585 [bacterium]|nr:hypothetical protein [candidate division CSSED10-310 bacterium]
MNYYYLLVILVGLAGLGWGFWASFEARKPFNILGAVLTPLSLLVALLGVLLLCVPDFFQT